MLNRMWHHGQSQAWYRANYPTSLPDLTNVVLAECNKTLFDILDSKQAVDVLDKGKDLSNFDMG